MKLLIDMNLAPLWVGFLADEGFQGIHWPTVGRPSAPDSEIMEYAMSIGDVVVRALRASVEYLDSGALVTVDPVRSRIRILPI